jgi:hypothetical protein
MAMENDVVLIYFEENPIGFARIEDISPDVKKDWYQVTLLLLQLPLQTVTWILRDVYIDGAEFTMNGKKMRLEKVVAPGDTAAEESDPEKPETAPGPTPSSGSKVISLKDRQPK